jgi:hypothetical protein
MSRVTIAARIASGTSNDQSLRCASAKLFNYLFWLRDGTRRDDRRSFLGGVLELGSRDDSRRRIVLLAAVHIAQLLRRALPESGRTGPEKSEPAATPGHRRRLLAGAVVVTLAGMAALASRHR